MTPDQEATKVISEWVANDQAKTHGRSEVTAITLLEPIEIFRLHNRISDAIHAAQAEQRRKDAEIVLNRNLAPYQEIADAILAQEDGCLTN